MQEGQSQNEPGWVFKPGDQAPSASEPAVAEAPTLVDPPQTPEAVESTPKAVQPAGDESQVQWTASEYLANPKSSGWFGLLAVCSIILAVVVWFLTDGDIVSTVVIALVGIIIGVFGARQPRTLSYRIDNQGLTIGEKFYPYESFKSFSIANEHAIGFISLLPLKRFMPPLVIHYAPEDEERIARTLADYLPFEEHKPDLVDSFTRRLRF